MSFITNGGSYEWKIKNGANTFGAENLCGGTLRDGLYEKITIGNVISRELNLKLWNPTIDPTEPIVLKLVKVAADGTTTEIGKGTYFVDTIEESPYSEYSSVHAYDALLKAEVPYMKSGDWVETTDKAIVEQIASDIGVSVSADTLTLLANPMTINEVPSIGDNGTTSRELLSVVAVMRGGNFIINDDNELELVPLQGKYEAVKVVTINSLGLYQYEAWGTLSNEDEVVTLSSGGLYQNTPFASLTDSTVVVYLDADGLYQQDTWENVKAIVPPLPDTIVIGDEVVSFDVSPTETIKRVEVWSGSSKSYRSPSGLTNEEWEAEGGVILSCSMPIMASQTLADDLYTLYNNFTYIPYKANSAYFDPDTPLGTKLTIKSDTVILSQRTLNVDVLASCDLEAGETAKVVSYYPYVSPVEREIKQDVAEAYTRITLNEESITAEATKRSEEDGYLSSLIQQTADEITISFTQGIQAAEDAASTELADYADLIEQYIRFVGASIELGESNSQFKALLTTTRLSFTGADGQEAAWFSNNELHINRAVIEETFSIGRWVQQEESNGSFSILYV